MPLPSTKTMYNRWFKDPSVRAYSVAVLLHVILFVFWGTLQEALLFKQSRTMPLVPEPVRFEFVDVEDIPTQEPQDTPLASHQNQKAQDQQEQLLPESAVPYVDGIAQSKESFDLPAQKGENGGSLQDQKAAERERQKQEAADEGFDFSEILKQDPKQEQKAQERAVFGRVGAPKEAVPHQNTTTRALERGGLQLSTYAWDYAPYMAYLKRQIDRHIFPPRAFDLGLLEGTTKLKFRIYRNGRLEGPELLGFEGSEMLKNTSVKAVELSAPFKGLPKDFPDDYLEIVGTFEFIILRVPPE